MPLVTNCPRCNQPVSTYKQIEIGGKHYPLFRCPRCTERLGVGRQSSARLLAFVVDSEGHVRRLSEITASQQPGGPTT